MPVVLLPFSLLVLVLQILSYKKNLASVSVWGLLGWGDGLMLPVQVWCCLGKCMLTLRMAEGDGLFQGGCGYGRVQVGYSISEADSRFLWQDFGYCCADPKYLASKLNLPISSNFSLVLSAQFSCGGCFMSQGIRTAPSLTDQHWSDQQWCEPSMLALDFPVCNLKCYTFFKSIVNLVQVCKRFSMFLLMNPQYYLSNC